MSGEYGGRGANLTFLGDTKRGGLWSCGTGNYRRERLICACLLGSIADREELGYYLYNVAHWTSPLWALRQWDGSHSGSRQSSTSFCCDRSLILSLFPAHHLLEATAAPNQFPDKTMTRQRLQSIATLGVWLIVEAPKVMLFFAPSSPFQNRSDSEGPTSDAAISISWSASNGDTLLISTSSFS
jgi:hypothetical protein